MSEPTATVQVVQGFTHCHSHDRGEWWFDERERNGFASPATLIVGEKGVPVSKVVKMLNDMLDTKHENNFGLSCVHADNIRTVAKRHGITL